MSLSIPAKEKGVTNFFSDGAREAQKLIPELVTDDSRGYKAVRYNMLPLMLLQALKEQQEIVRRQQAENADQGPA